VDVWTFLWLMLALKIPMVGLFLIIRWALKDAPETVGDQDGGIGPRPRHPYHPRPPRAPRAPRRGPHRDARPASPPRIRALASAHRRPRV